jgi:hypothetical protein
VLPSRPVPTPLIKRPTQFNSLLPLRIVVTLLLARTPLCENLSNPISRSCVAECLLSFPGLGQLPLAPLLGSLGTGLSVQNIVPPPEAAGVVADKSFMVHVMVLSTGPEGQEMVQTPGELVAAVRIDGLEQAKHDPNVHGENVQVLGDGAPDDRNANGSESKNHDLNRRGIFSSQAEWSRILVVDLVDVLV